MWLTWCEIPTSQDFHTKYEIRVFVRKELCASLGVENTLGIAFVGKKLGLFWTKISSGQALCTKEEVKVLVWNNA